MFGDIEPNQEIPSERIEAVRQHDKDTDYVRLLTKTYAEAEPYTKEVAFFMEQVTGHIVPDFRVLVAKGVKAAQLDLDAKIAAETDSEKRNGFRSIRIALDSVLILSRRYAELAQEQMTGASQERKEQLEMLCAALQKVPEYGADTLYEALQSYILLWEVMCLEQAPNPFAFSVGNADRIFEPYRAKENLSREETAALLKHFLVFFNVADRSWAISQNLIISGRDPAGNDLTNPTSYALLDAYYDMNLPQPILSVKLHKNTPDQLYREMGRFFFSPGALTPSLFNDDSVYPVLKAHGVDEADIADYGVAGCQEPLIMGKDNGNTTNTWLNLPKILELTLTDGRSLITGDTIGSFVQSLPIRENLQNIRERFYENLKVYLQKMQVAANGCTKAVSCLPVPFLSATMGGMETGYDCRAPLFQPLRRPCISVLSVCKCNHRGNIAQSPDQPAEIRAERGLHYADSRNLCKFP